MKKLIAIAIAILVLCSLVSCGHEHEFSEWEIVKEPTCEEAGLKTRSCECGEVEEQAIDALGHNYVNGKCTQCGKMDPAILKKYVGVWNGYKVSSNDFSFVFSELSGIVKMEITIEFTEDGRYTMHYYVNGVEGEKYPQYGTFDLDGEKIILLDPDGNDGYGEIANGEMILYFSNGALRHYYRPNN